MKKMIAYEKLSKKKKRELNAAKRNTWGALRPVTRKPAYSGAYDRCKTRKRFEDDSFPCFLDQSAQLQDLFFPLLWSNPRKADNPLTSPLYRDSMLSY